MGKTLKKRCVYRDDIGEHGVCLYPVNARSEDFHRNDYPTLNALLDLSPFIFEDEEKEKINEEWAKFAAYDLPPEITEKTETDEFWYAVSEYVDAEGNKTFKKLAGFAVNFLLIPHSNASSERVRATWGGKRRKKEQACNFRRSERLCSRCHILLMWGVC